MADPVATMTVSGLADLEAALLELGAGFSPEFTGRENVYMNAAILGLNRAQVEQRLDDILAFAEDPAAPHRPEMLVRVDSHR